MGEFKAEYTLDAVGVRPATVEEAQSLLFAKFHPDLLQEWADSDKLLITSDGSLFVSDIMQLSRAQHTLTTWPKAWDELMEIIEDNCMQAPSYNTSVAAALLAAGWRPSGD